MTSNSVPRVAGKLLISAINLDGVGPHDLVATQFLSSLLAYMSRPAFTPAYELDQAGYVRFLQRIDARSDYRRMRLEIQPSR